MKTAVHSITHTTESTTLEQSQLLKHFLSPEIKPQLRQFSQTASAQLFSVPNTLRWKIFRIHSQSNFRVKKRQLLHYSKRAFATGTVFKRAVRSAERGPPNIYVERLFQAVDAKSAIKPRGSLKKNSSHSHTDDAAKPRGAVTVRRSRCFTAEN